MFSKWCFCSKNAGAVVKANRTLTSVVYVKQRLVMASRVSACNVCIQQMLVNASRTSVCWSIYNPIRYRLSTPLLVGLENTYRPPTVKTDFPNSYKSSITFLVDKTDFSNLYRPSTGFPVLKRGLANTCRASSQLACWISTTFQQAMW